MVYSRLYKLSKTVNSYKKNRAYPLINNKHLLHWSAYLKYGCISIREVYFYIRENTTCNDEFIRQLIWRDFYYQFNLFLSEIISKKNSLVY